MNDQPGLFAALRSIYSVIITAMTSSEQVIKKGFSVTERVANSADIYASWLEDEADAFVKAEQVEREARYKQLQQRVDEELHGITTEPQS